jgi:hypothetical protein
MMLWRHNGLPVHKTAVLLTAAIRVLMSVLGGGNYKGLGWQPKWTAERLLRLSRLLLSRLADEGYRHQLS